VTQADLTLSKPRPPPPRRDPAGFDYTLTLHDAGRPTNLTGFHHQRHAARRAHLQTSGQRRALLGAGETVTCTNRSAWPPAAMKLRVTSRWPPPSMADGAEQHCRGRHLGHQRSDATNDSATATSTVVEDVQLTVTKLFNSPSVAAGGAAAASA